MQEGETLILTVKVRPGSRREYIRETGNGTLEVAVNAKAEKGQANQRLVALLSLHFKVPAECVRIVQGRHSRRKVVAVHFKK